MQTEGLRPTILRTPSTVALIAVRSHTFDVCLRHPAYQAASNPCAELAT